MPPTVLSAAAAAAAAVLALVLGRVSVPHPLRRTLLAVDVGGSHAAARALVLPRDSKRCDVGYGDQGLWLRVQV